MSADTQRKAYRYTCNMIRPQIYSERSLMESVVDFFSDVVPQAYSNTQKVEDKEKIQWVRFENCDCNDIAKNPDQYRSDTKGLPLLLILGYSNGVQIWHITPNGESQEILSIRQGPVRILRILPTPDPVLGYTDSYANKRPLAIMCDSSSAGQPYCGVKFVSLKSGDEVHSISFKTLPIHNIECNKRFVVVIFMEKMCVYEACQFQQLFWITSCYPCPGPNINPVALSTRWLAYADKRLVAMHQSCGGMSGDGSQSYAATVISAAKGAFKGLSMFGEAMVSSVTGSKASPVKKADVQHLDNGNRPGIVTVVDIQNIHNDYFNVNEDNEGDGLIAHFHAHANEPVSNMAFDPTGTLLVTSCKLGHNFHVFRLMAHPCSSSLGAVHHLYTLHRGDTTAKVIDISFNHDSRWVTVSTHRGTTHLFPITTYGGPVTVRTHCQPHMVNRASRFHKSAGLEDIEHSSVGRRSPVLSTSPSSSGQYDRYPTLIQQNTLNNNMGNPRLPPYPHPITVYPAFQVKQPLNVVLNPANKNQSPSHSPTGGDNVYSVCAKFSTPRLCVVGSPKLDVERREGGKRPVESLFVMAQSGTLVEYVLEPKAKAVNEKITDDTNLDLGVAGRMQWNLQRLKTSPEQRPPLPSNSPLILAYEAVMSQIPTAPDLYDLPGLTRQDSKDSLSSDHSGKEDMDEQWLSQVEIITHVGPHRRLWMGPQFSFKTYQENTTVLSSNSSCLLSQSPETNMAAMDITGEEGDLESLKVQPTRSNPVTMPTARPAYRRLSGSDSSPSPGLSGHTAPLMIEAGSFDQSPHLLDVYSNWTESTVEKQPRGSDDLEEDRIKETLADAMVESPIKDIEKLSLRQEFQRSNVKLGNSEQVKKGKYGKAGNIEVNKEVVNTEVGRSGKCDKNIRNTKDSAQMSKAKVQAHCKVAKKLIPEALSEEIVSVKEVSSKETQKSVGVAKSEQSIPKASDSKISNAVKKQQKIDTSPSQNDTNEKNDITQNQTVEKAASIENVDAKKIKFSEQSEPKKSSKKKNGKKKTPVTPQEEIKTQQKETKTSQKDTLTPKKETTTPQEETKKIQKETTTPQKETATVLKETVTPQKETGTPQKETETPQKETATVKTADKKDLITKHEDLPAYDKDQCKNDNKPKEHHDKQVENIKMKAEDQLDVTDNVNINGQSKCKQAGNQQRGNTETETKSFHTDNDIVMSNNVEENKNSNQRKVTPSKNELAKTVNDQVEKDDAKNITGQNHAKEKDSISTINDNVIDNIDDEKNTINKAYIENKDIAKKTRNKVYVMPSTTADKSELKKIDPSGEKGNVTSEQERSPSPEAYEMKTADAKHTPQESTVIQGKSKKKKGKASKETKTPALTDLKLETFKNLTNDNNTSIYGAKQIENMENTETNSDINIEKELLTEGVSDITNIVAETIEDDRKVDEMFELKIKKKKKKKKSLMEESIYFEAQEPAKKSESNEQMNESKLVTKTDSFDTNETVTDSGTTSEYELTPEPSDVSIDKSNDDDVQIAKKAINEACEKKADDTECSVELNLEKSGDKNITDGGSESASSKKKKQKKYKPSQRMDLSQFVANTVSSENLSTSELPKVSKSQCSVEEAVNNTVKQPTAWRNSETPQITDSSNEIENANSERMETDKRVPIAAEAQKSNVKDEPFEVSSKKKKQQKKSLTQESKNARSEETKPIVPEYNVTKDKVNQECTPTSSESSISNEIESVDIPSEGSATEILTLANQTDNTAVIEEKIKEKDKKNTAVNNVIKMKDAFGNDIENEETFVVKSKSKRKKKKNGMDGSQLMPMVESINLSGGSYKTESLVSKDSDQKQVEDAVVDCKQQEISGSFKSTSKNLSNSKKNKSECKLSETDLQDNEKGTATCDTQSENIEEDIKQVAESVAWETAGMEDSIMIVQEGPEIWEEDVTIETVEPALDDVGKESAITDKANENTCLNVEKGNLMGASVMEMSVYEENSASSSRSSEERESKTEGLNKGAEQKDGSGGGGKIKKKKKKRK